jgi:hypothetical protein
MLAAAALAGCFDQAFLDDFVPNEEEAFAKKYVDLLRKQDFDAAEALLEPSVRNPETRSVLEQVAGFFPPEEPARIRTVGAHKIEARTDAQIDLAFEYEYPNNWLLVRIALYLKDGETQVKGLHVEPLQASLATTNRFTFEGKGVAHYVFFTLGILIPIFTLWVLVLCVRTPIPKRKWLWVVFVALGFGQVTLNWSTGQIANGFAHVSLLGAGIWRGGPVAPWAISLSFPLGAVAFLRRRRRWLSAPGKAASPANPLTLRGSNGSLTLHLDPEGVGGWCQVDLRVAGESRRLGAETLDSIASSLVAFLEEPGTTVGLRSVLGLSEVHTSVYGEHAGEEVVLHFQDIDGKMFAQIALTGAEKSKWVQELSPYARAPHRR